MQRRVKNGDGRFGDDVGPACAAPGCHGQRATYKIAPVGSPSLQHRVAAGQQQPSHQHRRASSDQQRQGLPAQGDRQEGGEGRLHGEEKGSTRRSDHVDGEESGRASNCELHHAQRHDPRQGGSRQFANVGKGEGQNQDRRERDADRQRNDVGEQGMDARHSSAGKHRGCGQAYSPQQRQGDTYHGLSLVQ